MDFAQNIAIDHNGLLIDGKRFPFYIAADGMNVEVEDNFMGRVTVVLLAESVTVSPQVEIDADGDVLFSDTPTFEQDSRA